ncbi:hypothetical protein AVEN_241142-1 [Araneus ventricosus]|uniref:C2H2-type domain-containing protein n=1 Tax=Araneus ventricosus TaxID=182803 RepID=A0A4Y2WCL8_ARAVE|nr:hypothetical protein AVEN_241142-1 [Araneus ventricosus]
MAERVSACQPLICKKCEITFKVRKNLNAHLRQCHPEQVVQVKGSQLCGLCDCTFRTVALLHEHLENQNSVTLQFVNRTFYSEEEFVNWKLQIEKGSQSSFVIRNSSVKKEAGKKLCYYICHRSGSFKPKGEKIHHMKASGSIKSGSMCPAVMNVTAVTVDGIMEINVRYQSVHVGHELEIGKLQLSKNERVDLAANVQLGIPMAKILDKKRENFSATSRLSLTTRKDLHNISRDFRVGGETVQHQDDATTVAMLVKKLMNETSNPVLVYKAVGENSLDYPTIHQEDVLLGLMNDASRKTLNYIGVHV